MTTSEPASPPYPSTSSDVLTGLSLPKIEKLGVQSELGDLVASATTPTLAEIILGCISQMDYLDSNLHQSILSALASNLASSSTQDDVELLTDSFANLEPVSNGMINSVLSRLNSDGTTELQYHEITSQQVNGIIAFSRFAKGSPATLSNLTRVTAFVNALPNWHVESSLGNQDEDWSTADVVACELISATLSLLGRGVGERTATLELLKDVQQSLTNSIKDAAGHRIIAHILPTLNGIRRAIVNTPFPWMLTDPLPLSLAGSVRGFERAISEAANRDWHTESTQGRVASANLVSYGSSMKGLSVGLVQLCTLDAQETYLSHIISHGEAQSLESKWKALLEGAVVQTGSNHEGIETLLRDALHSWASTLKGLEGNDDLEVPDAYAFDVLLKNIRVATLSSIALGRVDDRLMSILEGLVSESSSITDETLQIGGMECVLVLSRGFPSIVSKSTATLRKLILSPSLILDAANDVAAPPALLALSKYYAICVELDGNDVRLLAIQSLFNHLINSEKDEILGNASSSRRASDARSFRSTNGRQRSPDQQQLISANVAHSVSRMASIYRDQEITRVTILMLLQKLQGHDAVIDGAIMYELADLARIAEVTTFGDIVKAIFDIGRRQSNDEEIERAVLTAQSRLAASIANRPALRQLFLTELLTYFIDIGAQDTSSRTVSALLKLIPIIDSFLDLARLDPRDAFDTPTVALFRNMWYLCALSGFLSTPSRIADWQRSALARISTHTPCLTQGTGDNFIETELEFNSILRRSNYFLTPDAAKSELSSVLALNGNNLRSYSTSQIIFLLTVFRVESLRAGLGRPSVMLSYFHHEGIHASSLYSMLSSISNQVNATFIKDFGTLVTRHSIDLSVYREVREILIQCCHQYTRVRSVSMRYFSTLVTSFPSLLCHPTIVDCMLELLTVLRRACQSEFIDEYTPVYKFKSIRGDFTLILPDDYPLRNSILIEFHRSVRAWLAAAITRAPHELQTLLQNYIDGSPPVGIKSSSAPLPDDEMGKSVAIDLIRVLPTNAKEVNLPKWGNWKSDNSAQFARTFGTRSAYKGVRSKYESEGSDRAALIHELLVISTELREKKSHQKLSHLRSLLYRCAADLVSSKHPDPVILHELVSIPIQILTEAAISIGLEVWTWVIDARPELESRVMVEATQAWSDTVHSKQGLFSDSLNRENPLDQETRFTPTDKDGMSKDYLAATRLLQPHSLLLSFLSSRFQAFRYRDPDLVLNLTRLITVSTDACSSWSTHQLARELRMRLLSFGFCVLQGSEVESAVEFSLRTNLYRAALSWFAIRAGWSYGSNRMQIKSDLEAIEELQTAIKSDSPAYSFSLSSHKSSARTLTLPGRLSLAIAATKETNRRHLLLTLLVNEADRLRLWLNPLADPTRGAVSKSRGTISESNWRQTVRIAWSIYPAVAVHLPERFKIPAITAEVTRLIKSDPELACNIPDALNFFVGDSITSDVRGQLRHLLFWAPVPVITALRFLFPKFGSDPVLLQYALRVLEYHPVEVTFFYIPQVVQALRTDSLGYAERFIFETSKISQLFCHQIIWNMKANAYRGDAGEEADPMKPTLDRMVDMIVHSLSGKAKDFYQREFAFFDEVTSISAKLKPFIRSTKIEKKAKIDEEMAKINVDPGVYLPSNPDGVVVDIDRNSGRPLQSHAKAPFMATFKVRREKPKNATPITAEEVQDSLADPGVDDSAAAEARETTFDTWQSAIFKVGDDCRQDVLALQIIAMHKNIFTALGLDLLVTPYRVTATGPGCGVIDVIPNATSRDEIGRSKVNDLLSYYILTHGNVDGIKFQKARINFIQSMAAYSLLCYLVQIKDRHNGNIMIDGEGRIIHIDFGFLFDIALLRPGGVKFEPGSFKLTHEMIRLMGGRDSVGFRMFTELTVKAFLACRPYGQAVVDTASLMLAAEFPSFKGEPTMDRLRDRFRLDLTEQEAAEAMRAIISNAETNPRSRLYDEFQLRQGGIPYAK